MKILNISSSDGIGGREMLVPILSEGLRSKGEQVRTITAPNTWLEKDVERLGFVNYSLPMKKYIDLYSIYKMGQILKEYKPDIVHLYYIPDIWLVVPAVKLFYPKAKLFLLRTMVSCEMKDWARTKLFSGLDKILTMSDFITNDFLSKTRVPADKLKTVYIGVDPLKFGRKISPVGRDDKENGRDDKDIGCVESLNILKQDYNLADDSIIVGLVGRIDHGKGQDKFIEAIKQVCDNLKEQNELDKLTKLKFFIVGSSEKGAGAIYETNLKERAKELEIDDKIIFTGFRADVPEVMQALDVAVFPSENEAFGLVVIEAMAAGKAVVGFRRGAFPEIIVDGKTGITTDYNYQALGAGILELILDDDKRKQFGIEGRKRILDKFTLDETIDKFLEMYKS